jgi:hypothetical protein
LELRVQGLAFRVKDKPFLDKGSGLNVQVVNSRFLSFRLRVLGKWFVHFTV